MIKLDPVVPEIKLEPKQSYGGAASQARFSCCVAESGW